MKHISYFSTQTIYSQCSFLTTRRGFFCFWEYFLTTCYSPFGTGICGRAHQTLRHELIVLFVKAQYRLASQADHVTSYSGWFIFCGIRPSSYAFQVIRMFRLKNEAGPCSMLTSWSYGSARSGRRCWCTWEQLLEIFHVVHFWLFAGIDRDSN